MRLELAIEQARDVVDHVVWLIVDTRVMVRKERVVGLSIGMRVFGGEQDSARAIGNTTTRKIEKETLKQSALNRDLRQA